MDQPGNKVANAARDQLNRIKRFSPVPVRAWEFGARETGSSVPSHVSPIRLNLVLTHRIPPALRRGVHLFILLTAIGVHSVPSFVRSRSCAPMAFTAENPPAHVAFSGFTMACTTTINTGRCIALFRGIWGPLQIDVFSHNVYSVLLSKSIEVTQITYFNYTRSNVLSLQPMIPPKRFYVFPLLCGMLNTSKYY